MPSVRSSYGSQGTRRGRRPFRRRRASVATRARFQRPTARNQRSQIRSLAKVCLANRRILNGAKAYTDWFDGANPRPTDGLWYAAELMSPVDWTASNRQNADVLVSSNIWLRNMVLELYCSSDTKTQACVFDIYVVSLRPGASNWIPQASVAGVWEEGTEYTTMGSGNSVIPNAGLFKTHANFHFRLYPRLPPNDPQYSGNPQTVYRNFKTNIRLGTKLRSPAALSWKTLTMSALPPHQRLYLIYRCQCLDQTGTQYALSWGTHVTGVSQS